MSESLSKLSRKGKDKDDSEPSVGGRMVKDQEDLSNSAERFPKKRTIFEDMEDQKPMMRKDISQNDEK